LLTDKKTREVSRRVETQIECNILKGISCCETLSIDRSILSMLLKVAGSCRLLVEQMKEMRTR